MFKHFHTDFCLSADVLYGKCIVSLHSSIFIMLFQSEPRIGGFYGAQEKE